MDRRSWLWRRKPSDKSAGGETESSGSLSSHSERFLDDQTPSSHNARSPEGMSKGASGDEHELGDTVKTLSEKLSDALVNIRAKEDLVKQHAKVAEEAVSGWESSETEVLVLKKQNNTLTQKNSILEERVGHLDGALKECLRQLRWAREEQEERIHDAISKKASEWESKRSEYENQIAELHAQLQNAKTGADNALLANARSRLEAAETENSVLKAKLLTRTEELKLRTNERDLSTHAAESASKQHLDSVKKVAKLEAECCRLKMVIRKATGSSTYAESFTESLLDSELCSPDACSSVSATDQGLCRHERILTRSSIVPPVGIDLMEDFLEMERLAALPEIHSETTSQDEVEAMINQTTELEENFKKLKAERENLEIALKESRMQLQASKDQLNQSEAEVVDLKMQLALASEAKRNSQKEIEDMKIELQSSTKRWCAAEANVLEIQDHLAEANEVKMKLKEELTEATMKKEEAESQLKVMDCELETLHSRICTLEKELKYERKLLKEAAVKGDKTESAILRMSNEFRNHQDEELAAAASKFAVCQKTIASLSHQLKSLATLEDFLINFDR